MKIKVIKVGSSKGVRIPSKVLKEIDNPEEFDLNITKDGIFLKPIKKARSNWQEAYDKNDFPILNNKSEIKQYNIYEFNLFHFNGLDEIIYGIVLSPDEMNKSLLTVIVAPLCNQCAITPTTFLIDDITRVKLNQLTMLPKKCKTKKIDTLNSSQILKIKKTMHDMLVL